MSRGVQNIQLGGRSDFLGDYWKPKSGPVGRKEISGCQHHDLLVDAAC